MATLDDFDRAVLSVFRILLDEFPSKIRIDIDDICESLFGEMPDQQTYETLEENSKVAVGRRDLVFYTAEWLGAEGFVRFSDGEFIRPTTVHGGALPLACLTAKALSVLRIKVDTLDGKESSLAKEAVEALRGGARRDGKKGKECVSRFRSRWW